MNDSLQIHQLSPGSKSQQLQLLVQLPQLLQQHFLLHQLKMSWPRHSLISFQVGLMSRITTITSHHCLD